MNARRRPWTLQDLPGRLQMTEPRHSFGLVLLAIVIAVIFQLAAPPSDAARLIGVVIQGSVVLLALWAAGARRHVLVVSTVGVVAAILLATAAIAGPVDIGPPAARLIALALILLTPMAVITGVIRELGEDQRVTVETVFCGLCLYLLIGTAFAFLFGSIEDLSDVPFFTNGEAGSPNDFLYFSLANLTTTGYGDFTAATELGRAMSVTEALMGQMYLVTVLAVIASNVRRRPLEKRR